MPLNKKRLGRILFTKSNGTKHWTWHQEQLKKGGSGREGLCPSCINHCRESKTERTTMGFINPASCANFISHGHIVSEEK